MRILYTEQNFADLKKQIHRRKTVAFGLLALFTAAVIVTLLMDNHKENRPELLTTLLVILSGSSFIFLWDMTIHPLNSYARHMDQALHGRTHEVSLIFDRVGESVSLVNGLSCLDLYFLGDPDKHGVRQQMFYWDQEHPLPEFIPGQGVTLTYYDRFIVGYSLS